MFAGSVEGTGLKVADHTFSAVNSNLTAKRNDEGRNWTHVCWSDRNRWYLNGTQLRGEVFEMRFKLLNPELIGKTPQFWFKSFRQWGEQTYRSTTGHSRPALLFFAEIHRTPYTLAPLSKISRWSNSGSASKSSILGGNYFNFEFCSLLFQLIP